MLSSRSINCFDKNFRLITLLAVALLIFVFLTAHNAQAAFSVSSSTPADAATNVGRQPSFILNFPNNACSYMTNIYLKWASNGNTIDTFISSDYSGAGTPTISFTVHGGITLLSNTAYYLSVTSAAFYDCISVMNMNDLYSLDFTTGTCIDNGSCPCYNFPICLGPCFDGDNIVKHLSPPDNGHFMQSYEGLNIVFNGNVSVGAGNVTIRKYSDDTVFETIDVTSNKVTGWGTNSVTINPAGNLANDTQYYVNFDIEGYSLTSDKNKWNFYTKASPNTFTGSGL